MQEPKQPDSRTSHPADAKMADAKMADDKTAEDKMAEDKMLDAERDVQARLGDRPIDFEANRAISNIYRAAAAVRRDAERGLLNDYGLSWGGFTILWVLWVWGEMETASLATECDLAKGTLTGMLTTLEKRQLVERARSETDGRRVLVSATPAGLNTIEELFPKFNRLEVQLVAGLTPAENKELSRLLRIVITNASPADDTSKP